MTEAVSRSIRPARVAAAAVVILLALSLIGAVHLYLARRLVLDTGVPEPWRGVLLAGIALLFVSLFAGPLAERFARGRFRRGVAFFSYVWMGVLWIALVALVAAEVVTPLLGAAAGPREAALARAGLVVALVTAASVAALRSGLRLPAVKRVSVALERWPQALEGLRIVQISDVHIGPLLGRRFAAAIVERVNALEPDLVAMTGDLVDGSVEAVGDAVEPFAGLRGRLGVYFVTGNHDVYSGDAAWVERVRGLGWRPLRNERVSLGEGDALFELAGVDDHRGDWSRGSTEDLPAALAGVPEGRAVVLLAHDPSTFKQAGAAGVDLQISGHTHGGQIWPFRYLVRVAVPFVAGLYRRGRSQLYVSRGTGFWGPPMRLFAPSEITEITLKRAAAPPA